jgi:hypothetical protein
MSTVRIGTLLGALIALVGTVLCLTLTTGAATTRQANRPIIHEICVTITKAMLRNHHVPDLGACVMDQ